MALRVAMRLILTSVLTFGFFWGLQTQAGLAPSELSLGRTDSVLPAPVPQERSSFGIQLDNDLFVGSDCNYTNGLRFSYLSETSPVTNGSFWDWQAFGMERTPSLRSQWALTLTQLIFTPENKSTQPLFGEHPYAGYLALGFGNMVKNEDRANSLELQLGVTGKASLADEAQYTVHHFWEMDQWPGWKTQHPSEVVFEVFFKRFYRIPGLEYIHPSGFATDGYGYWNIDAGTVYVRGGGGMAYRFGYNLPNDSATEYSLNGANYLTSPFVKNATSISNWSVYGTASLGVQGVAFNTFLDGPVFHHYPKYVTKYPVVGNASLGMGIGYKSFEGFFGYQWTTKEYSTQKGPQCVGTVELRYRF